CDPASGTCDCAPGFIGADCSKTCPENRYGKDCTLFCACGKGQCDPRTGKCTCPPGQMGPSCQ
ncbi:Multiple epidermal growth factor-like domains protein 6, partial [Cariama cristata]